MAKRTATAHVRLTLDVEIPLGEVTSLAEAAQRADELKTSEIITRLKAKAPTGCFNDYEHKLDGIWVRD